MPRRAVLLLPEGELKSAAASVLESLGIKSQPCPDSAKLAETLAQEKTHLLILAEKYGGKTAEEILSGLAKSESALKSASGSGPRPAAIVGLDKHSMARALELMNAGAWECAQPSILESDLEKIFRRGIERAESEPVRFPPKSPFWKKKNFIISAVMFAFLAAGGGTVKYRMDMKAREKAARDEYRSEKQFPLPYTHPSAIALQGRYFWIADWYAQSIYKHDPQPEGFVMQSVYHLADLQPVAITWEGNFLWILSAAHHMRKYEVGTKLKLVQSARGPGNNPAGMVFDGKNLWSADSGTRKVYRHAMDKALTVEAEFNYPGMPLALFWDGSSLWSVEGGQNRMLRHGFKAQSLTVEKYVAMGETRSRRVGAAFDGERFWTVAEKPPAIVREAIPEGP